MVNLRTVVEILHEAKFNVGGRTIRLVRSIIVMFLDCNIFVI